MVTKELLQAHKLLASLPPMEDLTLEEVFREVAKAGKAQGLNKTEVVKCLRLFALEVEITDLYPDID